MSSSLSTWFPDRKINELDKLVETVKQNVGERKLYEKLSNKNK
jgi:hypothetical protein